MAWYKYPSGFQVIKNDSSFIPQPGDFAVWTTGSYSWTAIGHTSVVVGPSTKDYFTSVDQNWYNANSYTGSPGAKIKHSYSGVTHFVRPPYKEGAVTGSTDVINGQPVDTKPISKVITSVKFTTTEEDVRASEPIFHFIEEGDLKHGNYGNIVIKNANTMLTVQDMYKYRNDVDSDDIPHYYVDRYNTWQPRSLDYQVPGYPMQIVIAICEDLNVADDAFLRNELEAITLAKTLSSKYRIPFNSTGIKVDKNAWRTLKMHGKKDILNEQIKDNKVYKDTSLALIDIYDRKDEILNEIPKDVVEKITIKAYVKVKTPTTAIENTTPSKITKETSSYTFDNAVAIQMKNSPQTSNGVTWYNATESQVRSAMNVKTIFNSASQVYQFLDLGKYQGIPVDNLNELLKGKGTLIGKGQAFADACKAVSINEMYLIAHAILESGGGTSNYANGLSGVYNYFGIGAYDNNPDYALTYARKEGWTTPEKAIMGGAKFVASGFIKKGQNTLYRMRWNPQAPGTHQYATDIHWASVQAGIIKGYYDKAGLKGQYFLQDLYKS